MRLQLPHSIASPQDVLGLAVEIRGYAKWFSHVAIKLHVTGAQVPRPPAMSAAASELINTLHVDKQLTQHGLDELIDALEDHKKNAPTATITLAAPATGELKEVLVGWCRQNLSPDMLVTFSFNSTLLGGMVIRYQSHVFDWSFRRQILANSHKFPEVLRRV